MSANCVVIKGFDLGDGKRYEQGVEADLKKKDYDHLLARGAILSLEDYAKAIESAVVIQEVQEPASIVGDQVATEIKE